MAIHNLNAQEWKFVKKINKLESNLAETTHIIEERVKMEKH